MFYSNSSIISSYNRPATFANAIRLGGRVNRDKNQICAFNVLVHVGREEEISPAGNFDHFVEAGLVNGQRVRVPRVNALLIYVDHGDLERVTYFG